MKNLRKVFKIPLFFFCFISFIFYSCDCERNNSENEKRYVYDGKVDLFCDGLIYVQEEGIGFIKPINLGETFSEQGLDIRVTFVYTGEIDRTCGGFVGNPPKIKILNIVKL